MQLLAEQPLGHSQGNGGLADAARSDNDEALTRQLLCKRTDGAGAARSAGPKLA
jgi:hypothetical protein